MNDKKNLSRNYLVFAHEYCTMKVFSVIHVFAVEAAAFEARPESFKVTSVIC
jgi:hypothetical protein